MIFALRGDHILQKDTNRKIARSSQIAKKLQHAKKSQNALLSQNSQNHKSQMRTDCNKSQITKKKSQ